MLAVYLVGGLGCGRSYVPVKGTITVGGKPAADGMTVLFTPSAASRPAFGLTHGGGRYTAATAGADGVMPGDYRVVVAAPVEQVEYPAHLPPPEEAPSHPEVIAYLARVEEIRNRPPKPGEPAKEYRNPATTPLKCTVKRGTSRYDFSIP